MNRAADVSYYPFQLFSRFVFTRPREIYYIGGNDILPPPLTPEQENDVLECLGTEREKEAKALLIEHNLRLVVYIAKKFDNTGVGVEDLISICKLRSNGMPVPLLRNCYSIFNGTKYR